MKLEEFEKLIGFKEREDDFGNIILSGGVTFNAEITILKSVMDINGVVDCAKKDIRERIIRHVYEDRRKQFAEKVDELAACNPMDFITWTKISREIVAMSRAL